MAISLVKFAIPVGGILVPLVLSAASTAFPLPVALMVIPLFFIVGTAIAFVARKSLMTIEIR